MANEMVNREVKSAPKPATIDARRRIIVKDKLASLTPAERAILHEALLHGSGQWQIAGSGSDPWGRLQSLGFILKEPGGWFTIRPQVEADLKALFDGD